jgi:glucose uptake protein GlcU
MEKKTTILNHSLFYGLITGALIAVYQLAIYIFGMANNKNLGNIAFFLLVIGLLLSVKHYRDQVNNGYLNFGKAFTAGLLTCVFAGVVGAVYSYFQFKYMSPQLIDELLAMTQDNLMTKGIPDSQIEMQSAIMEKLMTPLFLAFAYLFSMVFWGSLLSLVAAAIMKKPENPLTSNSDSEL